MIQKILFLICTLVASHAAYSQVGGTYIPGTVVTTCSIKYSYDDAGNRTTRLYSCSSYTVGSGSQRPNVPVAGVLESIVFPNPSNGIFTVRTNIDVPTAHVIVSDMMGKAIKQFEYNGIEAEYDIRTLAVGQYMIQLILPNGKQVHQLLKNE
jgi:Secretion system C-terminal sorting domain